MAAAAMSSCSYPGGTQQFVKVRGYGTRQTISIDRNASARMLEFTLSSADQKFEKCVRAGDAALAAKYVTPQNVNKPIDNVNPLFFAAANGNTAMADMLLKNGGNPESRNRQGQSLAFTASACGHPQLARHLASRGGGSDSDIARGKEYAQQTAAARQRQYQNGIQMVDIFARALFQSDNSSPSPDPDHEKYHMSQPDWQIDEIEAERERGEIE